MTTTISMSRDEFRAMLADAEQAGATEDERAEELHAAIVERAQ
jgi:hypothetical protein